MRIHRTMVRRLFQSVLGAIFFLFGIQILSLQAAVFSPETFTLDNGMQVVVVSNHRVPVVTHMVWYAVGSADEKQGESGIAHLLEHLMFKGTPTFPDGEFSALVARNGGQENAFTSTDYTAYHQTVAKTRLEMVMELEADRMTNLILSEENVRTERLVVMEERRSRVDNNPSSILREQINAALYLNYPYARPVIGWEHEILALDHAAIINFYRRWYAPNNAILIVAGDITVDELRPLAEKYYGTIARADTPPRVRPIEPPHRAARQIEYADVRVRQPSWQRVYIAPSNKTGETKHVDALNILADIMGGGATSRLYRAMIIDGKKAVSAGAYYSSDRLGPGVFGFYASPRPEVSMADIETAIDLEIDKILKQGVTQEEIDRSIRSMQASAIYARDSLSTGARVLGAALTTGQSIDDVESWPMRISTISTEDVQAAAQAVFHLRNSVTSQLLTEEGE